MQQYDVEIFEITSDGRDAFWTMYHAQGVEYFRYDGRRAFWTPIKARIVIPTKLAVVVTDCTTKRELANFAIRNKIKDPAVVDAELPNKEWVQLNPKTCSPVVMLHVERAKTEQIRSDRSSGELYVYQPTSLLLVF